MGWTNSHLHQFVADGLTRGIPDEDADETRPDQTGATLKDLPARFVYLYDFGDGWEHDVEVLGPGADEPGCRYGEGDCPPEDCGGPPGYAELVVALADPAHPDHARMREWAGELAPFDQDDTDRLVRQTVGTVPDSVRLVLDLAKGGVKLTPGGRLPRVVVRQVQQQRPHWYGLDRPASIEDDLPPLAALHDVLRRSGLLRLTKGAVHPTKAAGDDREVVRRLRSWFESDRFTAVLAGVTVAVLATSEPLTTAELAGRVHPRLGHGWARNGQPLTEDDVQMSIRHLSAALRGLDLIEKDRRTWSAGPSACCLLPGATALAHPSSRF